MRGRRSSTCRRHAPNSLAPCSIASTSSGTRTTTRPTTAKTTRRRTTRRIERRVPFPETASVTPDLAGALPVYRLRPSRRWVSLGLGELWSYRELLYFLVWREIKVRYKQTALGV